MLLYEERKEVAEHGRKMLADGFTRGTGGNISIYNRSENLVAISPSGKPYGEIEPENVPVIDLDAQWIEGTHKPSSEYPMHLKLYHHRDDVSAVIHTHSTHASAYSCLRKTLPAAYYLMLATDGPVRCAEYALTGSEAIAANALKAMEDRRAALLANHGVIVGARSIDLAYFIAEQVEFAAQLFLIARSGGGEPVALSEAEQKEMIDVFHSIGYGREAK